MAADNDNDKDNDNEKGKDTHLEKDRVFKGEERTIQNYTPLSKFIVRMGCYSLKPKTKKLWRRF